MTAARAKPVQAPSRPWSRIIGTRSQFTTWSGNGPRCGRYGQSRMSMRSGIASSRRPWTRSAGWEVSARRRLGEGTRVVLGVDSPAFGVALLSPPRRGVRAILRPPSSPALRAVLGIILKDGLVGSRNFRSARAALGLAAALRVGTAIPRFASTGRPSGRGRQWRRASPRCFVRRAAAPHEPGPPCQCAIAGLAGSATSSLESVRSRITVMAPISAQPPSTSSPDVKSPVASLR